MEKTMEDIENRQRPNNLEKLLNARGLTYQAFSTLSGIGEAMFTKVIRYKYYPSQDTREAMARTLHVSEKEIWGEEGEIGE